MAAARFVALTLALGLLAFVATAQSTFAARDPLGGCGEDAMVEVCQPVCVTEPCYGYVCVHRREAEACVYP